MNVSYSGFIWVFTGLKHWKLLVIFSLHFLIAFDLLAQTKQWDRTFGSNNVDKLTAMITTADSGYLLAGYTLSGAGCDKSEVSRGGVDYWVVKIDKNGNKLWDKTFGGSSHDVLTSIAASSDGGYLLGGYSVSPKGGDKSEDSQVGSIPPNLTYDFWLVKIKEIRSPEGNVTDVIKQWDRTYGTKYDDVLVSMVATADGGYLLGGMDMFIDNDNPYASNIDYYILKIDANGGKLWTKTFGGNGNDHLKSIIPVNDGGYLLGGTTYSDTIKRDKSEMGRGGADYWVIRISEGGGKLWDKTFGGERSDELYTMAAAFDGGFILSGHSFSNRGGDKSENMKGTDDNWVIKIGAGGAKQWDKIIGPLPTIHYGKEFGVSILPTADNGFILASNSGVFNGDDVSETGRGSFDFWIAKINANGVRQWDKLFGTDSYDILFSIAAAPDGGYLLAGSSDGGVGDKYRYSDKSEKCRGNDDYWVLKCGIPGKCGPEGCKDAFSFLNPETGNVQREVRDLEVWGGVGEEPLMWKRYWNSRAGEYVRNYGYGNNWSHSYQYDMMEVGIDSQGRKMILIHYPEGEQNFFVLADSVLKLWEPVWAGTDKQLFQNGNEFILQKADGFRYRFVYYYDEYSYYGPYYQLEDFKDSHQNLYKLFYDNQSKKLDSIVEPAGRYLKVSYETVNYFDIRISKVSTNDGRNVRYYYSADGLLERAVYGDGTQATYTYKAYQSCNKLLDHAIDPRYDGAAANIKYKYRNASGFIKEVKNGADTTKVLVVLDTTLGIRTLTYPNNRKQVYEMLPAYQGQVKSYTNGLGGKTKFEYADEGAGFRTSVKDALGRTTTFNETTKYGNPLKITYPDGNTEEWTRDDLDLIVTYKDQSGHVTTYHRDGKHRILRIDYYDGSYETFSYNGFGQVLDHRLISGGTEHFTYDGRGLLTNGTDAEGNATTYTYDGADRLKTVQDARGNTTEYEYNERGLVTKMINPGGSFCLYGYDKFGNRDTVINELGNMATTEYDEFRRPKKQADFLHKVTAYSYDLPGDICEHEQGDAKPRQIKLPTGKITEMAYDVEWQKIRETTGAGSYDEASTYYVYDAAGRQVRMIDAEGKQWLTEYEVTDRKKSETDPLGNTTRWTYDNVGRIATEIKADGGITRFAYDDANQIITMTEHNNQVTKKQYDSEGNLVKLTDAGNNEYQFEYDYLDRRKKVVYPGGGTYEEFGYDGAGNLKTYRNRAGNTRTNSYDHRNRLANSTWDDNLTPSVSRTYDSASRLLTLTSNVGTLAYTYNDANQVTSETQTVSGAGGAKTITCTYKDDGLRESLKYPGGSVLVYDYTARNQMASIKENGQTLVSYKYDFNGNRLARNLPNKTAVKYTYDDANRVLRIDHQLECASFSRFDYGYDKAGRRKFVQRNHDKGDVFGYDAFSQLTEVKYDVPNPDGVHGTPARSVHYGLDAMGNRTDVTDNGTTTGYTSNSLNQYISAGGAPLDYTANGSVKTGSGWTYTYDAEKRLIKAEKGNTTVDFHYDPKNRCVKRVINGIPAFFYYDDWNLVEERNGSDDVTARYVHGAGTDEIVARISANDAIYYHHDALGSVAGLTNSTGTVVEQYAYDVYGAPVIKDGAGTGIAASAYGNRFLFTGREYIREIGLYDYRNRIYSNNLGRFLQTDPLGFNAGDNNAYRYVGNNPVNATDHLGLYAEFFHYEQTRQIAIRMGFSIEDAEAIAKANQGVDDNPETSPLPNLSHPWASESRRLYHFTSESRRSELHLDALADKSNEKFGIFLHAFQDSYSHQRGETQIEKGKEYKYKFGHWWTKNPDKAHLRPALADKASKDTYTELRVFYLFKYGKMLPDQWKEISNYTSAHNRTAWF